MMKTLRLHEEILLLALRNEAGTIHSGTSWPHAEAGAVMAELLLEDRLRLEEREGKQRVSEREDRLEQIAKDRPFAAAARAAIDAVRAAMVAITTATTATTVASN